MGIEMTKASNIGYLINLDNCALSQLNVIKSQPLPSGPG